MSSAPDSSPSSPSTPAKLMGYGGLIPFVLPALGIWLAAPDWHSLLALALLAYGTAITSFLGAIHWGFVMREASAPSPVVLGWGVVPSLVAWIALMLGMMADVSIGLFVIGGLLWLCFAADRQIYPRFQAAQWLPMRLVLTVVASASCILGAWGMLR